MENNGSKKYRCIAKVSNTDFVKYRTVSNLVSFTKFLDEKFPDWRFINVFDKKTDKQLTSFTKKNRPTTKNL